MAAVAMPMLPSMPNKEILEAPPSSRNVGDKDGRRVTTVATTLAVSTAAPLAFAEAAATNPGDVIEEATLAAKSAGEATPTIARLA